MTFFQRFEIVAEVAHVLHRQTPEEVVYIDVCTDPVSSETANVLKYPTRTTLTVTDPDIIKTIPEDLGPGSVVRGMGSFTQGSYVPYKTTCIDTTFELTELEVLCPPMSRPTKPDEARGRIGGFH